MKLSSATKFNLFVIFIGMVIFLIHYCSPPQLVAWGQSMESPDWACIFENSDRVGVLWYTIPKSITIIGFISLIIFALIMNKPPEQIPDIILNEKGVTLVECMMVVSIIGILSAIAYTSIDTKPYRQRAAARELYGIIHCAKMEAIKRSSTVSLGINNNDYTIWCQGKKILTGQFIAPISVDSDDIASGGVNKTAPPKVIPPDIQYKITHECGGQLVGCQPLLDYLAPFAGTVYKHLTEFNSRGMVSSGNGTYKIHSQQSYIPVYLSMAGGVSIRPKQNE